MKIKSISEFNEELVDFSQDLGPEKGCTIGRSSRVIKAWLPDGPITLKPGERSLIPTGLFVEELENDRELQVRSLFNLSLDYGVIVMNSPGTINFESDQPNRIDILLINLGQEDFIVKSGDPIAKLIYSSVIDNLLYSENDYENKEYFK